MGLSILILSSHSYYYDSLNPHLILLLSWVSLSSYYLLILTIITPSILILFYYYHGSLYPHIILSFLLL